MPTEPCLPPATVERPTIIRVRARTLPRAPRIIPTISGQRPTSHSTNLHQFEAKDHVENLPSELLSEIFEHHTAIKNRSQAVTKPESPLLTITWVCRRWRNIALAAATLWTHIHIKVYAGLRQRRSERELVSLWIKRTRGLGLHVIFDSTSSLTSSLGLYNIDAQTRWYLHEAYKDIDNLDNPVGPFCIPGYVLDVSHRWESVHFDFTSMPRGNLEFGSTTDYLLEEGRLAALKEFSIVAPGPHFFEPFDFNIYPSAKDPRVTDLLKNAPKLQQLSFLDARKFLATSDTPRQNLTYIDLAPPLPEGWATKHRGRGSGAHRLSVAHCLEVLYTCPELRYARIPCGKLVETPPRGAIRCVKHRTLRTLILISSTPLIHYLGGISGQGISGAIGGIETEAGEALSKLLDNLRCPSLETLSINFQAKRGWECAHIALTHFLCAAGMANGGIHALSLQVAAVDVKKQHCREYFTHSPLSLQTFRLAVPFWMRDELLKDLGQPSQNAYKNTKGGLLVRWPVGVKSLYYYSRGVDRKEKGSCVFTTEEPVGPFEIGEFLLHNA